MSKLTYKASYYALYAMFAIILIVIGLFFFGGNATGDAVIVGGRSRNVAAGSNRCLTLFDVRLVWCGYCCYSSWCYIPIWCSSQR